LAESFPKMKASQVAALFALLAVLASLASISPALAWDNLLQNPGFEEGTTGWSEHGGTLIQVNSPVHAGDHAGEFTITSISSAAGWIYQVIAVSRGETYTFSGYAWKDNPSIDDEVLLQICWYESEDGSGVEICHYNSAPITGDDASYQPLNVTSTAPPNAHSARACAVLRLFSPGTATAYFDDLSFTGPPPPTPSPSPSPTPTPSPSPSPTPTPSPSPSPTPTLSPSPSPTPTPTSTPSPTPAGTTANKGDVVINEVQYDPPQSGADNAYEWVELFNRTEEAIHLEGWRIRDNREGDYLPPLTLPANGFAVIAATEEGFYANFPDFDGSIVFLHGPIGNGLSNDGDCIILEDSEGRVIDALSYGDDTSQSPHCPDVAWGHSLERSPAGSQEFVDNPHPTPGYGFSPASTPAETPVETQTPAISPTETPTAASPSGPAPEPSGGSALSGMALRGVGIALAIALFGIIFWVARRRGSRK